MELRSYIATLYHSYAEIDLKHLYETPKDPTLGEVALPCFQLSKRLGKSPAEIARDIATVFIPTAGVAHITAL